MKRRTLLAGMLVLQMAWLPVTAAQSSAGNVSSLPPASRVAPCIDQVMNALALEQHYLRISWFGQQRATKAELGELMQAQGSTWLKTDEGWVSAAAGTSKKTDAQMDAIADKHPLWDSPFRVGIFETRDALGSELIPPLLQSMRAFSCGIDAVCTRAGDIIEGNSTTTTPLDGCMSADELHIPALPACVLKGGASIEDVALVQTTCADAAVRLRQREESVLAFAVAEDSAQRALRQMAGVTDLFLVAFQGSLLTPLRQTVQLLSQFTRIPCFLGRCDR
jgi:hypothetical protein